MSEQRTNVTLNDISLMVSIIDVACKRGAIEGNEMSVVGTLRDKLDSFVKENMPPEAEETAEDGAE